MSEAQKHELLWMLWFDEKNISNIPTYHEVSPWWVDWEPLPYWYGFFYWLVHPKPNCSLYKSMVGPSWVETVRYWFRFAHSQSHCHVPLSNAMNWESHVHHHAKRPLKKYGSSVIIQNWNFCTYFSKNFGKSYNNSLLSHNHISVELNTLALISEKTDFNTKKNFLIIFTIVLHSKYYLLGLILSKKNFLLSLAYLFCYF